MMHSAYVGEAFEFEILKAHVPFHNPDYSFGRVAERCRIDVSGLLKEIDWDPASKLLLSARSVEESEKLDYEISLDAAEKIGSRVFFVPVQRPYRSPQNGTALELSLCGWRYEGLILVKDDHGGQNCYRRVGYFRWVNGIRFSELWEQVSKSRFSVI